MEQNMNITTDAVAAEAPARPAELPDKFWDTETGAVRVDALAQSYKELERHMSGMVRLPGEDASPEERQRFLNALGVPESPDAYDFGESEADQGLTPDPEVNRRLHEAGFSNDQARLVYDLAREYVQPLVEQAAAEFETERQTERLARHFGGEEKWTEVSRQLRDWGKANLPSDALQALSTTYEGCLALHAMMQNGEPSLTRGQGGPDDASLDALKSMMRDPRYWRDRDPAFVRQVTDGFARAYDSDA